MHIGIVGPCSNSVVQLIRALVARGHRVSVITLSAKVTKRNIEKQPGCDYYVYPMRTNRKMRDLYKVERQGLREGILLAQPDILHAQWTYEFALACLETNFPTVITSRDDAFKILRFSKDLYRLGRLFIQINVMRKARFLTAVSPYLASSLQWLAKTQIEVIPNFIESPEKSERMRCLSSGPVKIATVLNGWGSRKNPKSAIRAFNLLRLTLPEVELFMYGENFEDGGPAWRWASSRNLDQKINFCGFLQPQDLHRRLKDMSILLHPALEESFGMALLEAMALGVPVVAGVNSGGVPWVLDEGRAGFLTDVRKPEKIAESLLECITQPDVRKRKQEHAYDRVLDVFSPDSVAGQYEKLYERLLAA